MNEPIKVASQVVNGLSSQPMLLALMLFNLVVIAFLFWTVREAADRNDKRFTTIMKSCFEHRETKP